MPDSRVPEGVYGAFGLKERGACQMAKPADRFSRVPGASQIDNLGWEPGQVRLRARCRL